MFFFFTGDHADYHRPTDTADRINVEGMRRVTDLVQDLVPHWPKTLSGLNMCVWWSRRWHGRKGIFLVWASGPTIPHDGEGVMLSGVTDGGAPPRPDSRKATVSSV